MSWLSKIFGGGAAGEPAAPAETYKDFSITPQPMKEGQGWRIGALIEKDGQSHRLIRADVINDLDTARSASVSKAKQMIDEQGVRLFD